MNDTVQTRPSVSGDAGRGQPTRERILDAAEELFGQHGLEGTSLRQITKAAGVNLAAVNYHFQSKEALLREVVARRIEPLNHRRLELLEEAERAAAPNAPSLDSILNALLVPVVELHSSAANFVPIMGRMYTEPGVLIDAFIKEHIMPMVARVLPLLQRALPDLSATDIQWRMHFTFGAVAHVMAGAALIRAISGGKSDPSDTDTVRRQLIPFLVAGFSAAPEPGGKAVS